MILLLKHSIKQDTSISFDIRYLGKYSRVIRSQKKFRHNLSIGTVKGDGRSYTLKCSVVIGTKQKCRLETTSRNISPAKNMTIVITLIELASLHNNTSDLENVNRKTDTIDCTEK